MDWTSFKPTIIPKYDSTTENTNESVLSDSPTVPSLKEVPMGPQYVFQKGYPTSKTVRAQDNTGRKQVNLEDVAQKELKLVMSKDIHLLDLHGVAASTDVYGMLYPEGQTPLRSLIDQNAFLITNSFKIVDIANSPWPIDLKAAVDVRTQLNHPVRYKDAIGFVASSRMEDDLVLVQGKETRLVPLHDLEPIMLAKEGGVK